MMMYIDLLSFFIPVFVGNILIEVGQGFFSSRFINGDGLHAAGRGNAR